jgi:type I restriction enzyme S subunit
MAISNDDFMAMPLPVSSPDEQQKIADCLNSLDELIAAQGRKMDVLKTHKKGLMQQLFPRAGEIQPRLRFPEFQNTEEWKPVTFGALGLDVSDGNYSSKYPSQSDFVAKGVPFLRANNLRFGTVSDDDMRFISKEQHSQIKKGHLKKGDILITTRGELGTVALVPDRHIGSNINAQIVRINTGNKLGNTFLFQLLDYSRVIGLFDALSTGTALKQLPVGKLNQLPLHIPEVLYEQQRIADCLTSLDELIAAQTQKFEALKTHKKGLMQQLFSASASAEVEA